MLEISQYIKENGDNITRFAKRIGRHRQQVQQWVKAGNVYTDGEYIWLKKQHIIKVTGDL